MAFWDNLSQKASETTVKAMQKAKEMSDIAKLNSMISEEETKINNTYYQIGKLYVAMHSHDYEEEFAGMITTIGEADEKLKVTSNKYKISKALRVVNSVELKCRQVLPFAVLVVHRCLKFNRQIRRSWYAVKAAVLW